MNSLITLIADEKTSHLRELVINQKSKRQRPRRNYSSGKSFDNHLLKSSNFKSRDYNHISHRTDYNTSRYKSSILRNKYTTPRYDNSAHGYVYNAPRYNYSACGYEYSTSRYDYSARGYDHVKTKSYSKPTGTVTPNLRSCIEDLCNTSGSEVSFIVLSLILTIIILLLHIF